MKEKEGKLICQAEVLCEGKNNVWFKLLKYYFVCCFYQLLICSYKHKIILFQSGLELPRMNYDINGKRHRFVYANCVTESALSKQVTFAIVFNLAIAVKCWWEHPCSWFSYRLFSVICQERLTKIHISFPLGALALQGTRDNGKKLSCQKRKDVKGNILV